MLEDLLGSNSLIKVLDFLLENRFWEYTKKDIAQNSAISRMQFYRIWDVLEKYQIVSESRRIGATSLYKTNLESPIVKELATLSLEIADFSRTFIEEELGEANEADNIKPKAKSIYRDNYSQK